MLCSIPESPHSVPCQLIVIHKLESGSGEALLKGLNHLMGVSPQGMSSGALRRELKVSMFLIVIVKHLSIAKLLSSPMLALMKVEASYRGSKSS